MWFFFTYPQAKTVAEGPSATVQFSTEKGNSTPITATVIGVVFFAILVVIAVVIIMKRQDIMAWWNRR